eukprot:CAMPEP_0119041168 /NCGR_PEP_ID=MMETSP1177-20130426/11357_1 /TAXON_ID=2985 /ORGANISM="Ochromonas sp, Strain CCMP1899" /LENGTH=894 /DNA_ID=CAMNT_0007007001 /DNA_START=348 /DNA_END=3032 /DNA_ORIENTATION=+
MTGLPLTSDSMIPNHNLRSQINQWMTEVPPLGVEKEVQIDGDIFSEGPSQGVPLGSSSSTVDFSPAVEAITIHIELTGAVGLSSNKISLIFLPLATIIEVKRAIVRSTKGKFFPSSLIFRSSRRNNLDTLLGLRVKDMDHFIAANQTTQSCDASLTVSVKTGYGGAEKSVHLIVKKTDDVGDLQWRLWENYGLVPSKGSLWMGLKDSGDQMRSGQLLKYGQKLSSFFRGERTLELEIARATKKNRISESRHLTRLDTVKQLFHAFIGRMEAYDLRNQIGLVLFGSEATCACEITPFFEPFKKEVEVAHACGDTALYDALYLARGKLDDFSARFPNCRKRILCLSDGADNKSDISAVDVTIALQRSKVICDSIFIGIEDEESMLKAISVATGGYRFRPDTLKEALHLNELETVLSTAERESRHVREISASYGFTQQCLNKPYDNASTATRRLEPLLAKKVMSLHNAVNRRNKDQDHDQDSRTRDSTRRIMIEMKKLLKHPHPAIDIYPCSENDMGFWRLVLEGPDSTPYAQGTWLLYLKFPTDYPALPPELRFVTPIFHCNINSQGKICHSVLDRNWTPDMQLSTVFECLYGLLLSPDTSDPLDSQNALLFYDDSGGYEGTIIEQTKKYASRSRSIWYGLLSAEALSFPECIEAANTEVELVAPILTKYSMLLGKGASQTISGIGSLLASTAAVVDLTEMEVVINSEVLGEDQLIQADISLAIQHYERSVGFLAGSKSLSDCPIVTTHNSVSQSGKVTKGKRKVSVTALLDGGEGGGQSLLEMETLKDRYTCVLAFLYFYKGKTVEAEKHFTLAFKSQECVKAESLVKRAECRLQMGWPKEAKSDLEKVISLLKSSDPSGMMVAVKALLVQAKSAIKAAITAEKDLYRATFGHDL